MSLNFLLVTVNLSGGLMSLRTLESFSVRVPETELGKLPERLQQAMSRHTEVSVSRLEGSRCDIRV